MTIDYENIRRLVKLVEENRLTELAVEDIEGDLSVTIKAGAPVRTAAQTPAAQTHTYVEIQPCESLPAECIVVEEIAEELPPSENLVQIISPMIGVFYRRPSPDSPVFVEVGDEIEMGQTLGLIEAMKVFSEVPSEVAGRVVSLPAENGKLVQQGDILAIIDTTPIE